MPCIRIQRSVTPEERRALAAIARDPGKDRWTRNRALALLTFLNERRLAAATSASGLSPEAVCRLIFRRKVAGWRAALGVPASRVSPYPLRESPLEAQRRRELILRFRAHPPARHDWARAGCSPGAVPTVARSAPGPVTSTPAPAHRIRSRPPLPPAGGDEPSPAG